MHFQYYNPVQVFFGENCLKENSKIFSSIGKKAMLITGKNSAKINGLEQDLTYILKQQKINYIIFDSVSPNPDFESIQIAAQLAQEESVDFIIGAGGGSPMDTAKAIAVMVHNKVSKDEFFKASFKNEILSTVLIPTTAGSGSEVTPYSIISDHTAKTKRGLAHPAIYPRYAFLDSSYMKTLPLHITINTALDALSHSIESFLSVKNSLYSELAALKSIELLGEYLPSLQKQYFPFSLEIRKKLLYASMLGGIAISQTGTTAVHALGYSLTYYKNIDHGRANALIIEAFCHWMNKTYPQKISLLLNAMKLKSISELGHLINKLLGKKESITMDEIELFSETAFATKNIDNTLPKPEKNDLKKLLMESF